MHCLFMSYTSHWLMFLYTKTTINKVYLILCHDIIMCYQRLLPVGSSNRKCRHFDQNLLLAPPKVDRNFRFSIRFVSNKPSRWSVRDYVSEKHVITGLDNGSESAVRYVIIHINANLSSPVDHEFGPKVDFHSQWSRWQFVSKTYFMPL